MQSLPGVPGWGGAEGEEGGAEGEEDAVLQGFMLVQPPFAGS